MNQNIALLCPGDGQCQEWVPCRVFAPGGRPLRHRRRLQQCPGGRDTLHRQGLRLLQSPGVLGAMGDHRKASRVHCRRFQSRRGKPRDHHFSPGPKHPHTGIRYYHVISKFYKLFKLMQTFSITVG